MPISDISVVPSWSFRDAAGNQLNPQLFLLLRAINDSGRLTTAAQAVGWSYRHCWNLLNHWEDFFGQALVEKHKGRGSRLTSLGEKLLWAEQRVIARLEPQLHSLASELNLQIADVLQSARPTLRMQASYGYAVAKLPAFSEGLQLDLQYRSAEQALAALARGTCDIAGFHLPAGELSTALAQQYRQFVKPRVHRILRLTTRQQGLIVAKGNPLTIHSLRDVADKPVRFINRQADSGTRRLLDALLQGDDIDTEQLQGYTNVEFTHSAVAAYVAAGMADVGLGVQPAAQQFGLDFIPLCEERYLFLFHQRMLGHAGMQRFMVILRDAAFVKAIEALPGYTPAHCGEICKVEDFFQ